MMGILTFVKNHDSLKGFDFFYGCEETDVEFSGPLSSICGKFEKLNFSYSLMPYSTFVEDMKVFNMIVYLIMKI